MVTPNISGPLTSSGIMIGSIIDNKPFILNSDGKDYWLDSILSRIVNPPIFSIHDNIFFDMTNNKYLSYGEDNVTLKPSSQGVPIQYSNDKYSSWNWPTIGLSGIPYTFKEKSLIVIKDKNNKLTSVNTEIYLYPVQWYDTCTQDTYNNRPDVLSSVYLWFCMVDSKQCTNENPAPLQGYTKISLCQAGKQFKYCLKDKLCGDDNCMGVCNVKWKNCRNRDDVLSCSTSIYKYLIYSNWWKSPIFISIVCSIILLISLIIIITHILKREKLKSFRGYSAKQIIIGKNVKT